MNCDYEFLKKPLPFEQGTMTLWDDEYIASNVLKKHLQKDVDCGSRKETTINCTVKWINEIFPFKGFLLDIGCGPGLYARPFARCGFNYHGIDISSYQILYAKNNFQDNNIKFETLDFREFAPIMQYDVVLMLYGIYSFYNQKERIQLLKTLKMSLSPYGKVIVEVFTENHYRGRQESRDWNYILNNGFWSNKPYLELNAFYRYDDLKLALVQAIKIDNKINVWNSWIQTFTPKTLQSEFQLAGFTEFEFYSTCTGEPFENTADVLCMIAG